MKEVKKFSFLFLCILMLFLVACDKDSIEKPTVQPTAQPTLAPTQEPLKESEGLEMYLDKHKGYYVKGIGTCTDTVIVIPNEYNGEPIVGIHYGAFRDNKNITKVVMNNTIDEIRSNAFSRCENLEEVILNDSLTTLGGDTFSYCTSLKEIKIGDNVKIINLNDFNSCSSLEKVTLGKSVKIIGNNAFSGCKIKEIHFPASLEKIDKSFWTTYLEKITIDPENETYTVRENCLMQGDTLILSNINGTIPEGTTAIGDSAFWNNTTITQIVVPEGVTSIGVGSFAFCSNLSDISLPQSLTLIDQIAFTGCEKLTTIILPKTVEIKRMLFDGCKNLTHIYYEGNSEDWYNVSPAQSIASQKVTFCIYAETEAEMYLTDTTLPNVEWMFWRYVDGEPKIYT